MKIEKRAGFLYVTFQDPDWNNPAGGAHEIINEIKTSFPHASPENNDIGWNYDGKKREWTIPDTPINEEILGSIRDKYLPPNKNQEQLF